ncbi:helix-turn-helix domain-containing protein [Xanthobacteraceae bacterium A53D]
MLRFSTDDLRPEHRFDHWCDVRAKTLFGVSIELERERRPDFYGHFSARSIGTAIASDMRAASYRISRNARNIADRPGHSLCIGLQVRGPGWLETGRYGHQLVSNGDMSIGHSDLPYLATPQRSDGFAFRMLKIPLTEDTLQGATAHDLFFARLAPSAPYARPMAALFRALLDDSPALLDPQEDVIHAARLALLARHRLAAGTPAARAALRAGFLHAARDILIRDLHKPALSPEAVARELAISVRQVHVVFEPAGLSFSRTLASLRIRRAARMLRNDPGASISQIAFSCGFESLSAFYRAFQATYAMAPRDMRQTADDLSSMEADLTEH